MHISSKPNLMTLHHHHHHYIGWGSFYKFIFLFFFFWKKNKQQHKTSRGTYFTNVLSTFDGTIGLSFQRARVQNERQVSAKKQRDKSPIYEEMHGEQWGGGAHHWFFSSKILQQQQPPKPVSIKNTDLQIWKGEDEGGGGDLKR